MNRESKRIQGLDLLRVIGTLILFAWHYPKIDGWTPFGFAGRIGYIGVDLFFVITGFLICDRIFGARLHGEFSFKKFYTRRILRTLPLYFAIVAIYFIFPGLREYPNIQPLWKFLTFTLNFGLDISALCHAWTLSVTEQFYLIFPLLIYGLARPQRVRALWILILSLFAAGLAIRGWLWMEYIPSAGELRAEYLTHIYFPTLTRMDGLLAGTALAVIKNFHPRTWSLFDRKRREVYILLVILGPLSLYLAQHLFDFVPTLLGYPLLGIFFALLTGVWSASGAVVNRYWIPGVAAVSAWSYAIYLDHRFIVQLTDFYMKKLGFASGSAATVAMSVALTFAVSWLLYTAIEKPFRAVASHDGRQS